VSNIQSVLGRVDLDPAFSTEPVGGFPSQFQMTWIAQLADDVFVAVALKRAAKTPLIDIVTPKGHDKNSIIHHHTSSDP
jgi:hypothetical protein